MLGIVLFLGFAVGLPGQAAHPSEISEWAPYGTAGVIIVGGFILGMFFVRTVGLAGSGALIGGVIAAAISIFMGELIAAGGYALTAIAGFLISQIQAGRADSAGIPR